MSALSMLMERMCPACKGELNEGIFIDDNDGTFIMDALHCKPCNRVYNAPAKPEKAP